jgi:hypothetical protein
VKQAPALRVVAYDPQSKRKISFMPPIEAILEISGGIYSPFLDKERRKELAKIVCDSLFLMERPRGSRFELSIRWSGTLQDATAAMISVKRSWRALSAAGAKRKGKLYNASVRISKMELSVTMYSASSAPVGTMRGSRGQEHMRPHQLVVSFCSNMAPEAVELTVTSEQQESRIGRPLERFVEGSIRDTAARRLCQWFRATLVTDPEDDTRKSLHVELMRVRKGYLNEYEKVGGTEPGEDLRPVGVPECFMPLDTCGDFLYRRSIQLPNRSPDLDLSNYVVNVYTKRKGDDANKGLVLKMYNPETPDSMVLHVGPSVLARICSQAGEAEADLLRSMATAMRERDAARQQQAVPGKGKDGGSGSGRGKGKGKGKSHSTGKTAKPAEAPVDGKNLSDGPVEDGEALATLTDEGSARSQADRLVEHMVELVLPHLGVYQDPTNNTVPYITSENKGVFPN